MRQTRGRSVPNLASNCTIFTEWQPMSIPTIVPADALLRAERAVERALWSVAVDMSGPIFDGTVVMNRHPCRSDLRP